MGASASLLAISLLVAPARAASPVLPTGGKFLAGAGVVGTATNGSLNIVQSSGRGIIDWTSFSIGQGGTVSIANGSGATLNRVTGGQLSRIDGALTATGSLYFVNPQGIVVGAGGRVLGGGAVVLSSRDIANQSFLGGGSLIASGTSTGAVVNQGQIRSSRGDVVLIGQSAANAGSIGAAAGLVDLAAADTVLMSPVGGLDGVYVAADAKASGDVTQAGRIQAAAVRLNSAGGNVYTLAGNRTGLIEASGTATIDGQVWLTAPNGAVSAAGAASAVNADGSGGRIVASGKDVAIKGTAVLSAAGSRGGEILVGVSAPRTGLADTTTIADGAQILAGGPGGGGSIETSGHRMTLGAATVTAGAGGHWLTDPTDLTLDTPAATAIVASLNSGTDVTEQTTASTVVDPSGAGTTAPGPGDIIVAAPISWTGAGSLTLNAYHTATITAAIGGAGGFNVTAGSAIALGAPVSASAVSLVANGGNVTIGAAGSVSGTNGVTVAASANFINTAGAGAISSGGGRWLVYSTTPASNTLGGLVPGFIQYHATYPAAVAQPTGNGLIYSAFETINLSLHGTVSKVYDGTTTATIAPANLTASGVLGGDTVAVTGVYATPDVATGLRVSTTGITVTNGAAPVYGFTSNVLTASGNVGAITPKPLTASIIGSPTKVYDQSTTATLSSANYQVSGVVSGTLTVNQPSSVAYASANAGANISINATFGVTNFSASGGLNLFDYILPTAATGLGTITPAPLRITGVQATGKVYDRTTADTLADGSASLFGVLPGDTVTLSTAAAMGVFAQANVGSSVAVTASGFAIGGSSAANYSLAQPTGLVANITPAPLSLGGITANDKAYDGGTVATLNTAGSLTGVIAGDTVGFSTSGVTGAFAQADVGNGIAVSASGFALTGASAGNYSLAQPSGLSANITPVALTAAITATPTKVYDGTTQAYVASSGYTISGFISGQGATINQVAGLSYASPNAGSEAITAFLAPSDFVGFGATKLTNYVLPTLASGVGSITPAPITVQIVGAPTKTYDATTAASLNASNYQLQGFVTGEGASVIQTSGTYAAPDAGPQNVSALITGFLSPNVGTLLSNYSFPSLAVGVGLINPAPLTLGGPGPTYNIDGAVVGNPTKVYDGTTTLTGLTPANFSLSGFQGGDSALVTKTTGTYGAADAGAEPVTVSLLTSDYSFTQGSASNYVLPTVLYGAGTITPALVVATIVNDPTKVYNNSTRSVLSGVNLGVNAGSGAFLFTGFVGGDGVSLTAPILGAYASAGAGTNIPVTASFDGVNLTATAATNLANYILPTLAAGLGTIGQAPLYVTNVTARNKVYDTTTADALNLASASTFGLVAGDTVTLATNTAAATFAAANAGGGIAVTASGFTISGGASANYTLIQPSGLTANIFRAPVSVTGLTANSKVYDNTTVATLNLGGAGLGGVYASDSADVSLNGAYLASFASKNVGTAIAVSVTESLTGAAASNYTLIQPTGVTASITPAPLTATITNGPTKSYDGSASITLTASNYTVTGFVPGSGDGASIPQSASAAYVSPNVNIVGGVVGSVAINSVLVPSDFQPIAGTDLSNYALPTTGTGFGQITPIALSGSIAGNPTKVYDTTNAAALTTANYTLTGFVGAQSAIVTRTAGTYASANASSSGADIVTVSSLIMSDYNPGGGTLLTNYVLPTALTGPGTITKAPLTITGVTATNKVYDGTRADTLAVAGAALVGIKGSDALTLGAGGATGLFATANAANNVTVVASGFTFSGAPSANYTLTQPGPLAANITAKPITLLSVTKTYDGGTSGTAASGATYALSGVVAVDSGNVSIVSGTVTGSYTSQNVGTGLLVNLGGLSLNGSAAANYSILPTTSVDDPIGVINPKALTATIINDPTKPYDTTNAATLTTGNFGLAGFITGEGADVIVTKTSGTYASANASNPDQVATGLAGGDFAAATTLLTNYILPTTATGPGTITPLTLSAAIVGAPTKVYDTTTGAVLTPSNYSLSGFVGGQGASVTQNVGVYASAHAGLTDLVTASLALGNFTPNGGTLLSNYVLPATASGNGVINPALLTAAIVGDPTKPYDTTTTATLTAANYSFTGFLGGQGATVSQTVGTYASPNASPADPVTAALVPANFTSTGGALLSDYVLPNTASGNGAITPLTLTAAILGAPTKTYDATTGAVLTTSNFGLAGFVGGQGGDVSVNQTAGAYASPNASTIDLVTATLASGNFNATTTNLNNYVLPTAASGAGAINPAPLSVALIGNPTKPYDTTTIATLAPANYALTGFIGAETATVTQSAGVYASPNASPADAVTANLAAGDFTPVGATLLSNYVLPSAVTGNGVITPLTLSATIIGAPTKTYDATTSATLTPANYGLTGFVGGQGASVSQAVGSYASPDASPTDMVTASLAAGDFAGTTGTILSNYVLPTTASGNGVINPAPLTAAIVGSPTKPYDTTTAAMLTSANYSLAGFVGGDTATVDQTAGTYASADTGVFDPVTASLAPGNLIAGGATNFNNYILPTSATGLGAITPLMLMAAIINTPTKTYDGATGSVLTTSNFGLSGFIGGQGGDVTVNQTAGAYASPNASTSDPVTATLATSNFTATTTNLANYVLPASASGAGVINPALLSAAIVGAPAKPYDITVSATLAPTNYALTGFVGADTATVTQTAGTYASPNASAVDPVSASFAAGDFTPVGATLLSNYILPTGAAGVGAIIPLTVTAAIVGTPTKTYDATTSAALTSANYSLTGFIGGQGASVSRTAGTYASADASSADTVTASLASGDITAATGTLLSNYILPTTASGAGVINPALLAAAIVGAPTKTYDATNAAVLTTLNFGLSGFVAGQGGDVTVRQTAGTYASPDAGAADLVTASLSGGNFNASTTNLNNYVLPTMASGIGAISPARLSAAIVGDPTKTYDATTGAALTPANFAFSGFVGGQGGDVTVTQNAGTYASPNAEAANTVAAAISGDISASTTNLANYVLPMSASGAGAITPAPFTVALVGAPTKPYDATTAATLTTADYAVSGFIAGQGAAVTATSGTYASPNAGPADPVTVVLNSNNYAPGAGTLLSNYILPSSTTGIGAITPLPLTAKIVGTPTKRYDGAATAALTPANFMLSGFIGDQGAAVTASTGSYASAAVGPQTVSSRPLAVADYTPLSGTILSNYALPVGANGPGLIANNYAEIGLRGTIGALLGQFGYSRANATRIAREASFAVATPRLFIPFPAPGGLSTRRGNGLETPPIVAGIDRSGCDPAAVQCLRYGDGAIDVFSGPGVINATEEILLQGGKDKHWTITLPPARSDAANSGAQ